MNAEITKKEFWAEIKKYKKPVFLLGSGFSIDAGFPSMKMLSDRATFHFRNKTSATDLYDYYSDLGVDLTHLWTFLLDDSELVNKEEIGKKKALESSLRILQEFILKELYQCSWEFLHIMDKHAPLIKSYKEICSLFSAENSTILTTNWDLLVEYILKGLLVKDYKYPGIDTENKNGIPIIKIHGSMNWLCFNDFENILKRYPLFTTEFAGDFTKQHIDFLEKLREIWLCEKVNTENFLMPPTYQKSYSDEPYLSLKSEAFNAIKSSDCLVVMGYSFPPEDRFLCGLVRRSIVENIHEKSQQPSFQSFPILIVDPSPEKVIQNLGNFINTKKYLKIQFVKDRISSLSVEDPL